MTSEKKTFLNVISNILIQCILAISGLLIPKLILYFYGSTMNGLVNSISQFLTYAGLVELGVANAAVVVLYKPLVNSDKLSVNKILTSVKKKYLQSGILYTVIVSFLALLYPIFIQNQLDYWFVFWMVIIIAVVNTIDYFIIGKYKVLLIADQKYYILNFAKVFATICLTVFSCIFLILGASLHVVKIIAIVTHLVEALAIKWYVQSKYSWVNFKTYDKKPVIVQQFNALIHQIANVIVYNTDLVVLTLFLPGRSLEEVSVYTVYALAFGMINNLMTSFSTGFDATFGNMIARKEEKRLKTFYNTYEFWYTIILYLLYCCFIVLIIPFVRCYTQGVSDVNYIRPEVGILFGMNGILAEMKDPLVAVVKANGKFKETQNFAIMEAIINIVISLLLVRPLGIVGVLIGTVISHVAADIGYVHYTNKILLDRRPIFSWKNNFINMIILVVLIFFEFHKGLKINSWIIWILYSLAICIINICVFAIINLIIEPKQIKKAKDYLVVKLIGR